MGDWQPISTAPKDGSNVLLYAFIPPTEYLGFREPQVVTGYFDYTDDAWCTTVSTVFGPFVDPIVWMPLPPPPQGDRSPQGGDGLSGSVHESAGPVRDAPNPTTEAI